MSGKVTIHVRYAGGNQIPIMCEDTDTILQLVHRIQQNAGLFGLTADDIKLNEVSLFLGDKSNKTRKLEFSEHISVITRGSTVEFKTQPCDLFEIPVRYIHAANPVWIPCRTAYNVADLSRYIQENITSFRLATEVSEEAQRPGSEVVILHTVDGEAKQLNPLRNVKDLVNDTTLAFKIKSGNRVLNPGLTFLVKYETSVQPIRFNCAESEHVSDLSCKIRERINEFRLVDDDTALANKPGYEIILKTLAPKPGDKSQVLDPFGLLVDIKTKQLTFSFQSEEMRIVTLDAIKKKCVNQNIAFIGMPMHGKSSSINTIIKALTRLHAPLASTWKGASTGTAVLTPFHFDLSDKKKFTCVDVPGTSLQSIQQKDDKDHTKLKKMLGYILDGKLPANESLNYWAWYSPLSHAKYAFQGKIGRIHAIVYVHKGDSHPDKLGTAVIQLAQQRGRGIPVFGLITHIDKMTPDDITQAVEVVSNTYGMDKSRIFKFANCDDKEKTKDEVSTEVDCSPPYIQHCLFSLLSAAENYQTDGKVSVK